MIRKFMLRIFSNTYSGVSFTWMSWWHLGYLVGVFGTTALAVRRFAKSHHAKTPKMIRVLACIIPTVYVADFFLMPFSSENAGIQVIKLPFHICTLLAVLIPFAQFNSHVSMWREAIAVLSVTCSFLFLMYPGTALGNYDPWCYLVLQTFLYHGLMFLWGVLTIVSKAVTLSYACLKRVAIVIVGVIMWASFGNAAYTHGSMVYDWFMLTGRSLPIRFSPQIQAILPYCLPFGVFAVVLGASAIVIAVGKHAQEKYES